MCKINGTGSDRRVIKISLSHVYFTLCLLLCWKWISKHGNQRHCFRVRTHSDGFENIHTSRKFNVQHNAIISDKKTEENIHKEINRVYWRAYRSRTDCSNRFRFQRSRNVPPLNSFRSDCAIDCGPKNSLDTIPNSLRIFHYPTHLRSFSSSKREFPKIRQYKEHRSTLFYLNILGITLFPISTKHMRSNGEWESMTAEPQLKRNCKWSMWIVIWYGNVQIETIVRHFFISCPTIFEVKTDNWLNISKMI